MTEPKNVLYDELGVTEIFTSFAVYFIHIFQIELGSV